jgi:hypothetical protein
VGHRGHRPACRIEEISPGFIVCNRVPQTYELSRRVELALANCLRMAGVCAHRPASRRPRMSQLGGKPAHKDRAGRTGVRAIASFHRERGMGHTAPDRRHGSKFEELER